MLCWKEPKSLLYAVWISLQRIYIRHINKGYYSRLGFSEEHLRMCLSNLSDDIIEKKGKNSIYGKMHKGFGKVYAWLP